MKYLFLTDQWYDEQEKIRSSFGDIHIPETFAGIVINLHVTHGPEGDKMAHFKEGIFCKGHHEKPTSTMTMPFDICKRLFLADDTKTALKAIFTGKIKVDGGLQKMLALSKIKADGDLEKLRLRALEMTA